jgi:hypothetical protein
MTPKPNPLQLPEFIIHLRIHELDPMADVMYYRVPSALEQSYVDVSGNITEEQLVSILELPITEDEQAAINRAKNAFDNAKLSSELKSVTIAEAKAYIENNVTDLQSAKGVLKMLAAMVICLRDAEFPRLPES